MQKAKGQKDALWHKMMNQVGTLEQLQSKRGEGGGSCGRQLINSQKNLSPIKSTLKGHKFQYPLHCFVAYATVAVARAHSHRRRRRRRRRQSMTINVCIALLLLE